MRLVGAVKLILAILVFDGLAILGVLIFGFPFIGLFVSVVSVIAAAFLFATAYSAFRGAPFVPTDRRNVEDMVAVANIKEGDRVADLGSGDGRILIAAAKKGAYAEGWEINPILWAISLWNVRQAGVGDRVRVRLGSYWHDRLDRMDAVFLFLIDLQMRRMAKKLREELESGKQVISYAFRFPDWEHETKTENGVYLYRI